MIYEARPNVTVDAAGLCLKSGNAALLRGSSSDPTWRIIGPILPEVASDLNRDRHPDLVWRHAVSGDNVVNVSGQ